MIEVKLIYASIYFNVPNRIASSISNYIHEIQYRRTLYAIANQCNAWYYIINNHILTNCLVSMSKASSFSMHSRHIGATQWSPL